ncbi:MAG TPA: hypothetical protein ENH10_08100 [Bacteroidetes bacterium]|nr:hypothetical protein [Bacteroidota bacterium]HEX05099.1 hypothetical protein [Bacteroidota bacterium]
MNEPLSYHYPHETARSRQRATHKFCGRVYVFQQLQKQAASLLPKKYADLGDLISIDGSLIDAVLSMAWADYRKKSKKARLYLGFNVNQGIPHKLFLTNGKGDERPFVHQILEPGQTGIMDRGYQHHHNFDSLQEEEKHLFAA